MSSCCSLKRTPPACATPLAKWSTAWIWTSRFTGLPASVIVACWEDHFLGQSRTKISAARGIAVAVVDEAIRTHQRSLEALTANGTAGQIYFVAGEKGGLKAAAATCGLPLVSARYSVQVASRKPAQRASVEMTDLDCFASGCEWYFNKVDHRELNYDLGFNQSGEFTFREIRRSKGMIVGWLAENYLDACQLLSGPLETHHLVRILPFVRLVNDTFSAGQRHQKAGALHAMKDKRKAEMQEIYQRELARQFKSYQPSPSYEESVAA